MRAVIRITLAVVGLSFGLGLAVGCQSTGPGHVIGNEAGSAPSNKAEVPEYKKAVLRCYKSGGTRVVKIEGRLRCY